MGTVAEVKYGAGTLVVDGVTIGYTEKGFTVADNSVYQEVNVDEEGEPIGVREMSVRYTITCNVAEENDMDAMIAIKGDIVTISCPGVTKTKAYVTCGDRVYSRTAEKWVMPITIKTVSDSAVLS